ncbi:MAG: Hpt domain-containing protein [Bradyrhizobium sp.]|uniref:Hpt domain-containing protein n=1 Tax=Bradyrhizobium sp. TaxID=376 RepID=UPI002A288E45|nr:Hpt domain-containing protein [Bradyrhizobium sp.]
MSHTEVFDRTVYDRLVAELGADDAAEALSVFLADTAGKLARLSADGLDRMTARREAHAIKSSSATFGFLELSRLAREMEQGAEQMSPERLHASVQELQRAFLPISRLAEATRPADIREFSK